MSARVRNYAPAFLIVCLLHAACEGNGDGIRNPAAATSIRTSTSETRITAEPAILNPTFLASDNCAVAPPFAAEVTVIVRGGEGLVVSGLAFELLDRLGDRQTPVVRPGSNTSASVPTTPPLTLPTTSAVPIPRPGSSTVVIPSAGQIALPFSLEFQCGVPASGTLVIVVSTADPSGAGQTSEARVRLGR
jgi:hypothetical protein